MQKMRTIERVLYNVTHSDDDDEAPPTEDTMRRRSFENDIPAGVVSKTILSRENSAGSVRFTSPTAGKKQVLADATNAATTPAIDRALKSNAASEQKAPLSKVKSAAMRLDARVAGESSRKAAKEEPKFLLSPGTTRAIQSRMAKILGKEAASPGEATAKDEEEEEEEAAWAVGTDIRGDAEAEAEAAARARSVALGTERSAAGLCFRWASLPNWASS